MIPIIIKKLQTNASYDLQHHEVTSTKYQTSKHIVRELYVRPTFYIRKL